MPDHLIGVKLYIIANFFCFSSSRRKSKFPAIVFKFSSARFLKFSKEKLVKVLETCRILYNDFLAERRDKYEKEKGKITCFEQINSLPTRKETNNFLKEVHSQKKLNIAENIQLEPHSLRRAFATHNAINGVPLPLIQQQLGHFKISTTAIYIKEVGLANLAKCELI
ncbi:23677_t:CDS:2 [Racocetra persica]|uniref:23677_t:CDS:1 n=1 Tax=Racocetra persica TaxID=160502 RepID=A0ACA9QSI4_9GLOM|nr:23677_t:CDS:2 [Racocetra persica]